MLLQILMTVNKIAKCNTAFPHNNICQAALASHKVKATKLTLTIWFLHFIKGVIINLSIDDGQG